MCPSNIGRAAAVLSLIVLLSACSTISDLQSARLVGPGELEVTSNYSSASLAYDGESDSIDNHLGVQVATGLMHKVDLRLRYGYLSFPNSDDGSSFLAFGPKFGVIEDRVAIYAPMGFAFGNDIEVADTWEFHPTILLSHRFSDNFLSDYAEVTVSGRAVLGLNDDSDQALFGSNLGLGLSSDLDRYVIRPEVGFLKDPGEEGTVWQWSVGFTIYSGFFGK